MYREDLSEADYGPPGIPTFNVGWLVAGSDFDRAPADATLVASLKELPKHRYKQTRGYFLCGLCSSSGRQVPVTICTSGGSMTLGSAEICVVNEPRTSAYVAPNLIVHYVEAHEYRPPREFVDAVHRGSPWTDPILVEYPYGMGSIWAYVVAASPEAVRREFPQLTVWNQRRPPWMTDERAEDIAKRMTISLDDREHPWLRALRDQRG